MRTADNRQGWIQDARGAPGKPLTMIARIHWRSTTDGAAMPSARPSVGCAVRTVAEMRVTD